MTTTTHAFIATEDAHLTGIARAAACMTFDEIAADWAAVVASEGGAASVALTDYLALNFVDA